MNEDTALQLTLKHATDFPEIDIETKGVRPVIRSPNTPFILEFYQTRESLLDVDSYRAFIKNIISRFRSSRSYKNYKSYLMSIGLNRCQILGNINSEMVDIEMHHNFLDIFDITLMITEHLLNTIGLVCTFDVILLLIQSHKANQIPIVMMSETPHELYHNDPEFYIPPESTFGKWWELLYLYRYGITIDIANKVKNYIERCIKHNDPYSNWALQIKNNVEKWGMYNEYGSPKYACGFLIDHNNNVDNWISKSLV